MNSTSKMLAVAAISVALAGCVFSPETMPKFGRDNDVYVDKGAPERNAEAKAKVAVRVVLGAYQQYAMVGQSLASTLSDKLSKFAFFDLVDRSAAGEILKEQAASAEDPTEVELKGVESDFVVVARIASLTAQSAAGATQLDVQFDFSWVSMGDDQKVILKKSIRPTLRAAANANEVEGLLVRAAEKAASEFSQAISSKYAPPARVMETRGGGEAARINLGQDYGLAEGMEVEFFEIVDNSAVGGEARDMSVIGRGIVKRIEAKAAWVQVSDFERVNVRRGCYVRVLERKEGLKDMLMEKSGISELL